MTCQRPNFYTNAAFVEGEYAYVAAGNRELLALWIAGDYQPKTRQPRDPLGVDVDDDVVYGFGNFRDIGERTVVRAPTLQDSDASVAAFETGFPSWVEPRHHALWSTTATEQILTRLEGGVYRVYRAPLDGTAWQPDPGYAFLYNTAGYSVAVTTDGVLRVTSPAGATSETKGGWEFFVTGQHAFVTDDGVDDFGPVLSVHLANGVAVKWYLEYGVDGFETIPSAPSCNLANKQEEGGASHTYNVGSYAVPATSLTWCSRTVEPYIAYNRPAFDAGGYLVECNEGDCRTIAVYESGVAGALALEDGRVASTAPRTQRKFS